MLKRLLCALAMFDAAYSQMSAENSFSDLDINKDGFAQKKEFDAYFKQLDVVPPNGLFRSIDKNNDGKIDKKEFKGHFDKHAQSDTHGNIKKGGKSKNEL